MDEQTGATPKPEGATPAGGTQEGANSGGTPQVTPEMQALIDAQIAAATKKANAEAMTFRQELAAIKAKEKADADAKLIAEKKFEELATQQAAELAAAKAQLADYETYKAKVAAIEAARHTELLSRVPEANRAAFQDFTIAQLEKVVGLLPTTPPQSQGNERKQGNIPPVQQAPTVPFAGHNSDVIASLAKKLGG